jgi:acid phosphatase type 7
MVGVAVLLLLATAGPALGAGCAPEQVHLSFFSPVTNTLAVTWRTADECAGSRLFWSGAKFANSALAGVANVTADHRTYHVKGGYTHSAVTGQDVKPGQPLFYCVTGDGQRDASEVFETRQARARDSIASFKIAMKADEGIKNSEHTIPRVNTLVKDKKIDWIYHVGDISYANDYARTDPHIYEHVWNEYMGRIQPQASALPYMTCPGNHEDSCSNHECNVYAKNFAAYRNRFTMPHNSRADKNGTNMWFSFDYGFVHFVSLSTETDYPKQVNLVWGSTFLS